jgi:PASTA domain/Bacterial Ig-like domain (group 1)
MQVLFRGAIACLMLAAVLAFSVFGVGAASAAGVGGPVILGGDDLTDHGFVDEGGDLHEGWLYIQRALENISPKVVRVNDNSVAALGSEASTETEGDAGAAIGLAAAKAGLTVTYYEGADAINAFFDALAAGTTQPRIVWISGTGASNDLDSEEGAAVSGNATRIADFVNGGGGLMSHGVEYGWLQTLLPGLVNVNSGGDTGDLALTAAGQTAFPGVTDADVGAGPWHNHFEGDFGGLQILATSKTIQDSKGNPAAVLLGGGQVKLPGSIDLTPATDENPTNTPHTVTATVRDLQGKLVAGATVTFEVIDGPNKGKSGTGTTNDQGQATFTYTGDRGAGTDTIEARFVDQTETVRKATATKTWVAPPSPPAPPPPPPPPPPPETTPTPRTPRVIRRCTVPNVKGKTVAQARRAIARAGCRAVVMGRRYSASTAPGRVIGQTVKPGARVRRGTIVRLLLSRGVQPVRPPFTG